jgi:carbamoyl-phosphate synthase small subunit
MEAIQVGTVYLILENGAVFEGQSFGYEAETIGELVFNTGMTGYLESLTDPSYFGQILVQTFPLIGNYGVIPADFESNNIWLKAYIVREWCQEPSNFRSEGVLDAFLKGKKIPALCGIDTRALTRIVREHGVMNAKISFKPELSDAEWAELRSYRVQGGVEATSEPTRTVSESASHKYKVVLWNFGAKRNITNKLVELGCDVFSVPYNTTAAEIAEMHPDGVMLSNGPGDPADNTAIIEELKKLCTYNIPTFGICLGHQLLALSQGACTEKLHYGHRGANQPVQDKQTGMVFVTSQNHSYAVVTDSIPANGFCRFVNCNDGSCEGIEYNNMPAFSVQFHPEACAGPLDSGWLFDRFVEIMDEHKKTCGGDR